MDVKIEYSEAQLQNFAIRKMLADKLKALRCNGLARKVEEGYDENPRTLAAITVVRELLGYPPEEPLT